MLLVPMLGVEKDSLLIEQGGGHVLQILLEVLDAVVNPGNLNCVLSRGHHEGGVGRAEEQGLEGVQCPIRIEQVCGSYGVGAMS